MFAVEFRCRVRCRIPVSEHLSNSGVRASFGVEFRCQSVFSRGGRPRRRRNSGVRDLFVSGIPVSVRLFAWRTTTTARLRDDAEAMGNGCNRSRYKEAIYPTHGPRR